MDAHNQQYTEDVHDDDAETEAPQQQTPEEMPKQTPEQSGAPADDALENCSPEVRNAVIQLLNKPEPEPKTVCDVTLSTSGALDPATMPSTPSTSGAAQGSTPGNIIPTLLFGDWFY